MIKIIS